MSENQHTEQDLMFRSILENGQEEVPAHVWDGITSGLDHIARRKKVALWFRRAVVGVSAAAAIATGVIISLPSEEAIILPEGNEVAVAVAAPADSDPGETSTVPDNHETLAEAVEHTPYLAYVPEIAPKPTGSAPFETIGKTETHAEQSIDAQEQNTTTPVIEQTTTDEWIEEEPVKRNKIKASLVLSSTTGAAGQGSTSSNGMLRRPISPATLIQTGVTEIGDNNYGLPLSFGIGAKIDITPRWSVGVGVNYTLLTRKFEGDYMKVENGEILEYTQSEIRNMQHYIGIPVNVYYNIIAANKINFYAYAGGAVEKGLMDKYQILASKSVYKKQIQGVQWSANLGLGVEFMLGKHLGLYLDPSAKYYFNCKQPKSIRTKEPLMFGCEIGLRTRF